MELLQLFLLLVLIGTSVAILISLKRSRTKYISQKLQYLSKTNKSFLASKIIIDSEIEMLSGMEVIDRVRVEDGVEWITLKFQMHSDGSSGLFRPTFRQDALLFDKVIFPETIVTSHMIFTPNGGENKVEKKTSDFSELLKNLPWLSQRISIISGSWGGCFIKSGKPFRWQDIPIIVSDIKKSANQSYTMD